MSPVSPETVRGCPYTYIKETLLVISVDPPPSTPGKIVYNILYLFCNSTLCISLFPRNIKVAWLLRIYQNNCIQWENKLTLWQCPEKISPFLLWLAFCHFFHFAQIGWDRDVWRYFLILLATQSPVHHASDWLYSEDGLESRNSAKCKWAKIRKSEK